jgi:hypothetical protein
MGLRTLRLACLLTTAALIAGCGGASQTASSTARTAPSGPAKTARTKTTGRTRKTARPTRPRTGASRSSRFPAPIESSFRHICKENFRGALARAPAQYRGVISSELDGYCTCALHSVEGSVATERFKHDIAAFVSGQATLPAYMLSAERVCGAQLQQTLAVLNAGG